MISEQFIANKLFAKEPKIPGTNLPVTVTIEFSTLGSRLQKFRDGSDPIIKNTVYATDYGNTLKEMQTLYRGLDLWIHAIYCPLPKREGTLK